MTERLVYSVREAAEALGLGQSTVYEMVARGQLPRVPNLRRVLIPRAALERLAAGEAEVAS
jgi:excisionase family DNA binding protein